MPSSKTLPANPFWNFSVKLYQQSNVENYLLILQNERGLNINLILFCLWCAASDQGRIKRSSFKKILLNIQQWHELILLPLRRLRQALKKTDKTPWSSIREEIKKHELFSEQIEQLIILENFDYRNKGLRTNYQKIIDSCKNIATYCSLLQVHLDQEDCSMISHILKTIFSKIDHDIILRYCIEYLIEKEFKINPLTAQFPLDL